MASNEDSLRSIWSMGKMRLIPIGYVRNELTKDQLRKRDSTSDLVIYKKYEKALEEIESFSHITVIFWMHQISASERKILKARPRGRRDMPLVGLFATRSPGRPNPIGMTVVKLLEHAGNVLKVKGLDALDSSPILDLKPYDRWDRAEKIRLPKWWLRLEKERNARRSKNIRRKFSSQRASD